MMLSELRLKDVIDTRDGRSLGRVSDLIFCPCDGRVTALVVPGDFCLSALLRGEKSGCPIAWSRVRCIGDDVILVDGEGDCGT